MNDRQAIKRELRRAIHIISNPEKFEKRLFSISWGIIKSARDKHIYLSPKPYEQMCKAYEPDEPVRPSHQEES